MIKVNGENFVVTGAAGFIGSHLCDELSKQNKMVLAIDDLSAGNINNLNEAHDTRPITFMKHDVSGTIWEDGKFDGYDAVFHEACSKCTVCREDPLKDLMTNAWGSFQVFDAARKDGAKVVHASTGSVNHGKPVSFYGVSKLAGEQYLRAFKEYYGLRFVGLRYFHVFGPRQDSGPNGGVVAIFITKMLNGEPLTIYGDGEQTRSFTYVKDVVAANFHAANSTEMEGEYYNVASGVSISLNELVETLSEILDVKPKVEYLPVRKGDIKYFNVSNKKIENAGYGQWTDFKDALKETVGWYSGDISR